MAYHTTQCPLTGQWQVMYDDGTRPHAVFAERLDAEGEATRRNAECVVLHRVGNNDPGAAHASAPSRSDAPEPAPISRPEAGGTSASAPRLASGTFRRTQEPGPGLRATTLTCQEPTLLTATGA